MLSRRFERILNTVQNRQLDLTVCLENVHDPHNISAVIRSCDAVGIAEIYILYTEEKLQKKSFGVGKKAASGSGRWVKVHIYHDLEKCFEDLRNKYDQILSTHLSSDSKGLYSLDLTRSTAFIFGNEHDGISQRALSLSDYNINIPQVGMVGSLNISVACAVTIYEAFRQRESKGNFNQKPNKELDAPHQKLLDNYLEKQQLKSHMKK